MIPLHIAIERTDLNDVIELFAWNIQLIEFLFDLAQRNFAFARELQEREFISDRIHPEEISTTLPVDARFSIVPWSIPCRSFVWPQAFPDLIEPSKPSRDLLNIVSTYVL